MTLIGFLKLSCALIFGIYLLSVNFFKRQTNRVAVERPEPEAFTFFPQKGAGMGREELEKILGVSPEPKGTEGVPRRIPLAKQRKLAKKDFP